MRTPSTCPCLLALLVAVASAPAAAQDPPPPSGTTTVTAGGAPTPSYESGPPSVLTPQQEQAGRQRWKRCHKDPEPKGRVDVGQVSVIGPVPQAEIQDRIVTILDDLRCCYGVELESDPALSMQIVAKVLSTPAGTTQGATIRSTTVQRPKMEACFVEAFRRLVIPSVVGSESTVTSVPMLLSPPR